MHIASIPFKGAYAHARITGLEKCRSIYNEALNGGIFLLTKNQFRQGIQEDDILAYKSQKHIISENDDLGLLLLVDCRLLACSSLYLKHWIWQCCGGMYESWRNYPWKRKNC
ncbi:hypothetical protein ACSBR1_000439 [Camellia fascicularis]